MSERYEIATFFDLQNHPAGSHRITIDNYGQGKYILDGRDVSHAVKSDQPYTKPLSPCLIRFIQAANESVKTSNMVYCDRSPNINHQFIKDLYLLQDVQKEIEDEIQKQVIEKVATFEADYERRIQMFKEDFQAEIDEARKILQAHKHMPPVSPIVTNVEGQQKLQHLQQQAQQQAQQHYHGQYAPGVNFGVLDKPCNVSKFPRTMGRTTMVSYPTPIIEHINKPLAHLQKCKKCNVHSLATYIKNCNCAYKDCCSLCVKGQSHRSDCALFCNGKIWIE